MTDGTSKYDASRIQVLEGHEAVRRRPGMYVGSTGERGLRELVFNVAERALGEVLAGRATRVEITLMSDGGVRIADDGRAGGPELEALLTHFRTGRDLYGHRVVSLGFFGVGPFVTNALSSRLTAEERRDGVCRVREFVRGAPVVGPVVTGPATGSGTTITFVPDPDLFVTVEFSFAALADRFRELAFLNRDLDITLTDEREPRSLRLRFPGGVREFVTFLEEPGNAPLHPDVVCFEAKDTSGADVSAAATVEVALRWSDRREERIRSFADNRSTHEGGTHLTGFREGLGDAVNAYARERGLLAPTDPDLGADRVAEGLTAVVSVQLEDAEFTGATCTCLGNTAVHGFVAAAVRQRLGAWFEERPDDAAAVVGRLVR